MSVDLHHVLVRKQERECARADDFAFRVRARAWRHFGEWLRDQRVAIDPVDLVRRVATAGDDPLFEALIDAHRGDRRVWRRALGRAQARAAAELRVELGDPAPYRLA